jgi:hypothetical protein
MPLYIGSGDAAQDPRDIVNTANRLSSYTHLLLREVRGIFYPPAKHGTDGRVTNQVFSMDSSSKQKQLSQVQWPPLPTSGFLSGRVATQEDVDQDVAAFGFPKKLEAAQVSKITGEEEAQPVECPGSIPLDIVIPQYAILHLNGEQLPCIIIQGEEAGDSQIVGCRLVKNNSIAIGLLEDFELLGQATP